MSITSFLRSYVFGPSGFRTMAPLRCAAKFDPLLSLDCARVEGVGAEFCHLATLTRETNLGNFICDVMVAATNADFALLNSGTLRSDSVHHAGPFLLCLEEEGSFVVHRVGPQGAEVEEGKVGVGRGNHHIN